MQDWRPHDALVNAPRLCFSVGEHAMTQAYHGELRTYVIEHRSKRVVYADGMELFELVAVAIGKRQIVIEDAELFNVPNVSLFHDDVPNARHLVSSMQHEPYVERFGYRLVRFSFILVHPKGYRVMRMLEPRERQLPVQQNVCPSPAQYGEFILHIVS